MKTQAIIVAAGQGTRISSLTEMRSDGRSINKCALPIGNQGKPLVCYPVEALISLGISNPIVVVKHLRESVESALANIPANYVEQGVEKGTAKAVEAGMLQIDQSIDEVIVLYGDSSLFITSLVIEEMIAFHRAHEVEMTCLSVTIENPTNLGRIVRNSFGEFVGIVEEKDATEEQKQIKEINTGAAIYSAVTLRELLPKIEQNPLKGEYYLTDVVALALRAGYKVEAYVSNDAKVGIGINSIADYEQAQALLRS